MSKQRRIQLKLEKKNPPLSSSTENTRKTTSQIITEFDFLSVDQGSWINPPLLWASSCDKELTATLHSEQYSSFLALSSSVSGLDGLLEAEVLPAPDTGGPDPSCSEPAVPLLLLPLPLPQPGDEEGGIKGGVGVGCRGHTEGTGESMGGVGGVVSGGRGPGASRGPFNCVRGRGSSKETKRVTKKEME